MSPYLSAIKKRDIPVFLLLIIARFEPESALDNRKPPPEVLFAKGANLLLFDYMQIDMQNIRFFQN